MYRDDETGLVIGLCRPRRRVWWCLSCYALADDVDQADSLVGLQVRVRSAGPDPRDALTSFSESTDDNTEDDAAFEDDGWGSSVVTQRTWSIEAEGRRKRTDATAFTPDPGQEAVRKAGRVVGFAANITVRWYRRGGAPDAYQGVATVSGFTKGGSTTDLEPFNFTLNGQGGPVEITNPATTAPAPAAAEAFEEVA